MFCGTAKYIVSGICFLVCFNCINAQVGNRFGIDAGLVYASQDWNVDQYDFPEKESKAGFALSIHWEHSLTPTFRTILGLGYMQKGFNEHVSIPNGLDVTFHDLTVDLGMKISPLRGNALPYLSIGFRGEQLMETGNFPVECTSEGDVIHRDCASVLSYLNDYHLGGFLKLGLEWDHRYYIEAGYNPTFTNLMNNQAIDLWERCWEFRFGYFIGVHH